MALYIILSTIKIKKIIYKEEIILKKENNIYDKLSIIEWLKNKYTVLKTKTLLLIYISLFLTTIIFLLIFFFNKKTTFFHKNFIKILFISTILIIFIFWNIVGKILLFIIITKEKQNYLKWYIIFSFKFSLLKFLAAEYISDEGKKFLKLASKLTNNTNLIVWGSLARKIYTGFKKEYSTINDIDIVNNYLNAGTNIILNQENSIKDSLFYSLHLIDGIKVEYIRIKYFPKKLINEIKYIDNTIKIVTEATVIASSLNQLCYLILAFPNSEKINRIYKEVLFLINNTREKNEDIIEAFHLLLVNNSFLYYFVNDISKRLYINDENNFHIISAWLKQRDNFGIHPTQKALILIRKIFNDNISKALSINIIKLSLNKKIIFDKYYSVEFKKNININKLDFEFSSSQNRKKFIQKIGRVNPIFENIINSFSFLLDNNEKKLCIQAVILIYITTY